ncbi:hypothetical protein RRG08_019219 [Elysia crispata]|uniref:Uncharacterized protein n=1 Tax=Elysia crispata TaxID=231223 RepID=A0AAE1AUH5_9GAST|nr:hypothetical protein RRG08_019219 [Elysia crispata]
MCLSRAHITAYRSWLSQPVEACHDRTRPKLEYLVVRFGLSHPTLPMRGKKDGDFGKLCGKALDFLPCYVSAHTVLLYGTNPNPVTSRHSQYCSTVLTLTQLRLGTHSTALRYVSAHTVLLYGTNPNPVTSRHTQYCSTVLTLTQLRLGTHSTALRYVSAHTVLLYGTNPNSVTSRHTQYCSTVLALTQFLIEAELSEKSFYVGYGSNRILKMSPRIHGNRRLAVPPELASRGLNIATRSDLTDQDRAFTPGAASNRHGQKLVHKQMMKLCLNAGYDHHPTQRPRPIFWSIALTTNLGVKLGDPQQTTHSILETRLATRRRNRKEL